MRGRRGPHILAVTLIGCIAMTVTLVGQSAYDGLVVVVP